MKELNKRLNIEHNKKLIEANSSLDHLIKELGKREIPLEIITVVNQEIEKINSFSGSDKDLLKQLRVSKKLVIEMIEKELELVPRYHYQNKWMAFGILAGVLFSTIFNQLGFSDTWNSLGMGISMGLLFGMLAGKNRDEKAFKEGKQLNF